MPYKLVCGEFHLFYVGKRHVGSQPDGDSAWFKPDNPALLKGLDGRSAQYNGGGFAQLRFEAIDALELHFEGAHQAFDPAAAARNFMLSQLGFKSVDYAGALELTVADARPHPIRGYIFTRSIDPYGRPVSFVFAGKPRQKDGADVYLEAGMLEHSANLKLAKSGNAYPTFYSGLPTELRTRVLAHAAAAKRAKKGLWAKDKSTAGVTAPGLEALQQYVIWPKLFRRLVAYFKDGHQALGGFDQWLRADPARDDQLWIASKAEMGNMHDVVAVTGNRLKMRYAPADLIIVPR